MRVYLLPEFLWTRFFTRCKVKHMEPIRLQASKLNKTFCANMKLPRLVAILSTLVICGCASQGDKQTPVTMLPSPSSRTNTTRQVGKPHLEGDSLYADQQAALTTFYHLLESRECVNYINEVLRIISAKASGPDYSKYAGFGEFDIRIEIYQNGSIGNVSIYGYTNAVLTPLHIQAIKHCSPLPPWPDKMRAIVGQEYWVMYIRSGFGAEPGPG